MPQIRVERLSTRGILNVPLKCPFEVTEDFCGSTKLSEQMTEKLELTA